MTIEDIIEVNYMETELPELIITEGGYISEISKIIFESIKDSLKKSFKPDKAIGILEENGELIEKLQEIENQLLRNIINSYGSMQIDENVPSKKPSSFWDFTRNNI